MKKINTCSAQYKIIQPRKNNPNPTNPQSFAQSRASRIRIPKAKDGALRIKKILSKDRQEFINNIAASGFKQFNL